MVGSSILPACIHKGKLYFLFGRENSLADTPGWSDFGGGVDSGENVYEAALREGGEELTGFLGGPTQISRLIKRGGGALKLKSREGEYYVHIFMMPYSEDLVAYYNNNHAFLWNRMNKKMLNSTKLFEKIEIKWFSVEQMRRERNQFRNFYRAITDMLADEESHIRTHLNKCYKRRSYSVKKRGLKKGTRKNNRK